VGSPTLENPRAAAARLLARIQRQDAYANLVLASAELSAAQAPLITELVYGVTRMCRALDHLIDPYVAKTPDITTHNLLRVGAYQIHIMNTPVYAAVDQTVAAAPAHQRGFVNAVLRRVADTTPVWPSEAVRLSYPDWIVQCLESDLGTAQAHGALQQMNQPPPVTVREDGYVQDIASQWVADLVKVQPAERVLDMCAGPGGKATAIARCGNAEVVAAGSRPHRAALVADNARRTATPLVGIVAADGCHSPFLPASFDHVLIDAPGSGLGVLGRRADARWRISPTDVTALAKLQAELINAAFGLVRGGGTVVYSVCTMTAAETIAIDELVATQHPDACAIEVTDNRWRKRSRGAQLLPQDHNTDGMFVVRYRAPHK